MRLLAFRINKRPYFYYRCFFAMVKEQLDKIKGIFQVEEKILLLLLDQLMYGLYKFIILTSDRVWKSTSNSVASKEDCHD